MRIFREIAGLKNISIYYTLSKFIPIYLVRKIYCFKYFLVLVDHVFSMNKTCSDKSRVTW